MNIELKIDDSKLPTKITKEYFSRETVNIDKQLEKEKLIAHAMTVESLLIAQDQENKEQVLNSYFSANGIDSTNAEYIITVVDKKVKLESLDFETIADSEYKKIYGENFFGLEKEEFLKNVKTAKNIYSFLIDESFSNKEEYDKLNAELDKFLSDPNNQTLTEKNVNELVRMLRPSSALSDEDLKNNISKLLEEEKANRSEVINNDVSKDLLESAKISTIPEYVRDSFENFSDTLTKTTDKNSEKKSVDTAQEQNVKKNTTDNKIKNNTATQEQPTTKRRNDNFKLRLFTYARSEMLNKQVSNMFLFNPQTSTDIANQATVKIDAPLSQNGIGNAITNVVDFVSGKKNFQQATQGFQLTGDVLLLGQIFADKLLFDTKDVMSIVSGLFDVKKSKLDDFIVSDEIKSLFSYWKFAPEVNYNFQIDFISKKSRTSMFKGETKKQINLFLQSIEMPEFEYKETELPAMYGMPKMGGAISGVKFGEATLSFLADDKWSLFDLFVSETKKSYLLDTNRIGYPDDYKFDIELNLYIDSYYRTQSHTDVYKVTFLYKDAYIRKVMKDSKVASKTEDVKVSMFKIDVAYRRFEYKKALVSVYDEGEKKRMEGIGGFIQDALVGIGGQDNVQGVGNVLKNLF